MSAMLLIWRCPRCKKDKDEPHYWETWKRLPLRGVCESCFDAESRRRGLPTAKEFVASWNELVAFEEIIRANRLHQ